VLPGEARRRWLTSRTLERAAGRALFRTIGRAERTALNKQRLLDLATLIPDVITEEYASAGTVNLAPYARSAGVPVLIIAGARDPIVPLSRLQQLVALMPRGTLDILIGQGHMAPIEQPLQTAVLTERFLDRMISRP
jgi:pimeloyl-ACP methyl ester carboxylesterase